MAVKNKKRRLQPLGGKVKSNNGQNGESGVKERKEHHGRKKHGRVSDDEEFEIASSYIAPSSYSEVRYYSRSMCAIRNTFSSLYLA
jgi:hypothetical protein